MAAIHTGINSENIRTIQKECLYTLFKCVSLSGLPGEAREEFTVCAEIYHLGLPDCFFRGGEKDCITFFRLFIVTILDIECTLIEKHHTALW